MWNLTLHWNLKFQVSFLLKSSKVHGKLLVVKKRYGLWGMGRRTEKIKKFLTNAR